MVQISNFEQVRADGNVVPAAMTISEMIARGWAPSKVVALRWSRDGDAVEYVAPNGAHGIVVPGADFVAAILAVDSSGTNSQLTILSPDGSIWGKLENNLSQGGVVADGRFSWFEPAMTPDVGKFGVVFQTASHGEFRCDVDARELRVLTAVRTR